MRMSPSLPQARPECQPRAIAPDSQPHTFRIEEHVKSLHQSWHYSLRHDFVVKITLLFSNVSSCQKVLFELWFKGLRKVPWKYVSWWHGWKLFFYCLKFSSCRGTGIPDTGSKHNDHSIWQKETIHSIGKENQKHSRIRPAQCQQNFALPLKLCSRSQGKRHFLLTRESLTAEHLLNADSNRISREFKSAFESDHFFHDGNVRGSQPALLRCHL